MAIKDAFHLSLRAARCDGSVDHIPPPNRTIT